MEIYECQDKTLSSMEIINYFTASLLRDLNEVTYTGVPICFFISPRIVLFKGCMNWLHQSTEVLVGNVGSQSQTSSTESEYL